MRDDEFRSALRTVLDDDAGSTGGDWSLVVTAAGTRRRRATARQRAGVVVATCAVAVGAVIVVGHLQSSPEPSLTAKARPRGSTQIGATSACLPLPASDVSESVHAALARTSLPAGTSTLVDATVTNAGTQSIAFSKVVPTRLDAIITRVDGTAIASSDLGNLESTVGAIRRPIEPGATVELPVLVDTRECVASEPPSSGTLGGPRFGDALNAGDYKAYLVLPLADGPVLVGPVSITVVTN